MAGIKVIPAKGKKKRMPVAGKCSPGKKLVGGKCVVDPNYKKPKRGDQTYKKAIETALGKGSILENKTFKTMKDLATGLTAKKKEVKKFPYTGPMGTPFTDKEARVLREQLKKYKKRTKKK